MPTDPKEIESLERGEDLLQSRKKELSGKIDLLSKEIDTMKADAANKEEERDALYYETNKIRYPDVDLKDLIVVGSAKTTIKVGELFEFTLRNLQKKDSLFIDQNVKNYSKETNVYADNKIRLDILTKALVSFGLPGKAVMVPSDFEKAVDAVSSINEECLSLVWEEYVQFNRWVQCAVRTHLKNSLRLQRSGSR